MNESKSAQINHCSISPRKENIPRVSYPWKAMEDIKTYAFALNVNQEIDIENNNSKAGVR